MATISILGSGFGGLITTERFAGTLGSTHQITLASPRRQFTFYPALAQLAFGVKKRLSERNSVPSIWLRIAA